MVGNKEGRGGKDVRGREGNGEGVEWGESRERAGKARLGYLSRGPEFLVIPLYPRLPCSA